MNKLLSTLLASVALLTSQTTLALVVYPYTYFECEATDGQKIVLNSSNGKFTLAYGDMTNPNNRISTLRNQATYLLYKENGMAFYSISATEGDRTYTIFQSQDKNPSLGGINIKVGSDTQKIFCKAEQDKSSPTPFSLEDIFKH